MPTYVAQNATSTTIANAFVADLTTMTLSAIVVVIGLAALLVGIGYAWRKVTRKATGGKF